MKYKFLSFFHSLTRRLPLLFFYLFWLICLSLLDCAARRLNRITRTQPAVSLYIFFFFFLLLLFFENKKAIIVPDSPWIYYYYYYYYYLGRENLFSLLLSLLWMCRAFSVTYSISVALHSFLTWVRPLSTTTMIGLFSVSKSIHTHTHTVWLYCA